MALCCLASCAVPPAQEGRISELCPHSYKYFQRAIAETRAVGHFHSSSGCQEAQCMLLLLDNPMHCSIQKHSVCRACNFPVAVQLHIFLLSCINMLCVWKGCLGWMVFWLGVSSMLSGNENYLNNTCRYTSGSSALGYWRFSPQVTEVTVLYRCMPYLEMGCKGEVSKRG